jgi:hypothetical protein
VLIALPREFGVIQRHGTRIDTYSGTYSGTCSGTYSGTCSFAERERCTFAPAGFVYFADLNQHYGIL